MCKFRQLDGYRDVITTLHYYKVAGVLKAKPYPVSTASFRRTVSLFISLIRSGYAEVADSAMPGAKVHPDASRNATGLS